MDVWQERTGEYYCREDRFAVEEYIKKKRELYVTSRTILTTHDWAIHSVDKLSQIDTVVFDEDPINALAPIDNVKISDLTKMANKSGETMFP